MKSGFQLRTVNYCNLRGLGWVNWPELSKGSRNFTSVRMTPCLLFHRSPQSLSPPLVFHSTVRGCMGGWNPFWMASDGNLLNSRERAGSLCVLVPRVLSFIFPATTATASIPAGSPSLLDGCLHSPSHWRITAVPPFHNPQSSQTNIHLNELLSLCTHTHTRSYSWARWMKSFFVAMTSSQAAKISLSHLEIEAGSY